MPTSASRPAAAAFIMKAALDTENAPRRHASIDGNYAASAAGANELAIAGEAQSA